LFCKKRLIFLVVLIIILNLSLIGCGQKSKSSPSQKPQSEASGEKPKAPKSAETILKDINSLIGELDKRNKTAKAPWMAAKSSDQPAAGAEGNSNHSSGNHTGQGTAQGDAAQGSSEQGGSEGSASGSSSGMKNSGAPAMTSGKGQSSAEQDQMQWQKIGMSLMDIHEKWNELEPEAIAAGLPASSRNGFENALQRLTQSVSEQNTDASITAAIDLFDQYTSGLSQIFTLSTPPQLYQVQYRTMAALSAADREDWTAASDEISAALEPWGLLKAQAKKVDNKLLVRCEFSLQDLKTAISKMDPTMVMIKGDIAQANLKNLEKKLSQGSQGK